MENEDLKKQLQIMEGRLERLEKIEQRRKTTRLIKLLSKLVIIILVLICLYKAYTYVNNTYIKPYKETIDKLESGYDKLKSSSVLSKILG